MYDHVINFNKAKIGDKVVLQNTSNGTVVGVVIGKDNSIMIIKSDPKDPKAWNWGISNPILSKSDCKKYKISESFKSCRWGLLSKSPSRVVIVSVNGVWACPNDKHE